MGSAGMMGPDSALTLWFSGLGKATFELTAGADLYALSR